MNYRFVRRLADGSTYHLGTAVQYRDGWKFVSNVSSHRNSRKFHEIMEKCLPPWLGYPDKCESEPVYQVGDERWRVEHISYKAWCDLARSRGWDGTNDADGLRDHAEPEEAATIVYHTSKDAAIEAARQIFKDNPDDSAFGAVLVEHQILEGAYDDRGNPVRGCPPSWECHEIYEVTSDGIVTESQS